MRHIRIVIIALAAFIAAATITVPGIAAPEPQKDTAWTDAEFVGALSAWFDEKDADSAPVFTKMVVNGSSNPIAYYIHSLQVQGGTASGSLRKAEENEERGLTIAASTTGQLACENILPLCRRAAESGKPRAQQLMGWMTAHGWGVPANNAEAVGWYLKAAAQGLSFAQNSLGAAYDNNWGVTLDKFTAFNWYRKAAEQGIASAQCAIAIMYYSGHGTARSFPAAAAWARKAAEQGYAPAQILMGTYTVNGEGVSKDIEQACVWFSLARMNGVEAAANALERLAAAASIDKTALARTEASARSLYQAQPHK